MTPAASPPPVSSFARGAARRIWTPLAIAFLVEALLLVPCGFWLARRAALPTVPVAPAFGPLRLTLRRPPTPEAAATAPPAPTQSAAPKETSPAPEARAEEVPKLVQPDQAPAPAPRRKLAHHQPPPPKLVAPEEDLPNLALLPHGNPAPPGPKRPAPPLSNGQLIRISEFNREVNEALHAAAHDLTTERGIKMTGRVEIAVHYRDGKAWGAWIVRSSGLPALDQAVLDGVARAVWPPPPPGLEGRELIIPILGSFW
jgi:periplasmic protein TonB